MSRKQTDRVVQFKVLLSVEERGWLDEMAEEVGLTASDVLRRHIRDWHTHKQKG
jgi:hypothetical protein